MLAGLAALPLAVVLAALGVFRKPAAAAGAAGLAVALALAFAFFDMRAFSGAAIGQGAAALGALTEAASATAIILWIILPALAIFELQKRAGAFDRIREALSRITTEPTLQVLLIAWFFGLFMEGAAGFGTPVALAAPLLVGLGYDPVRAVTLALLGHAVGVSFGAVGTPVLAQVEAAGLPGGELALATAALHVVLGTGLALAVVSVALGRLPGQREAGWALLAAACFLLPALALAAFAGPELPTLGGALLGGAAFIGLVRRAGGGDGARVHLRALVPDLAPYLLIVALVLATRLIAPLRDALSAIRLEWSLHGGAFSGSFMPLYHPGSLLLLGFLAGAIAAGRGWLVAPSLLAAVRRLLPVATALLAMLALARVMTHSGMIRELAEAAVAAGPVWPLLAPLVGVLGTFVTGSATSSNILFTGFQTETAASLGLSPVAMAAAQGFGAAIGNAMAPHNIIAGSATVGLAGREGDILARTALPVVAYALAGGLLLLLCASLL